MPSSIEGCTLHGQIRKAAASATVIATFTFTVVNAGQGIWSFGLSDEVTALITAGAAPNMAESRYVYDVELHDAAGNVHPRLYGNVFVTAEVTRAP